MDDIRQKLVISQDSFLGLRNIEAILSKKWIQHRKLGAYRIVGLEKRLLWGALGNAELSHQEVGIALTDEAQHLELLLKMAASGTSCFVCSLENRHPRYCGAFICTAPEL